MNSAAFDPLLSVFPSATDPDTVADLSLSVIMGRIRSLELAGATARIAAAYAAVGGGKAGKDAIAAMKRAMPGVTLAGTFDRRANAAWREPSGLVQIDLDNLGADALAAARALLTGCPWVACLWVSPSGAGLKGAVCVPGLLLLDPTRYTAAWRAVTKWLASLGLVNDAAAKDAARLAFLAHDPQAWYNSEVQAFDLDRWSEPAAAGSVVPTVPAWPVMQTTVAEKQRRALAYVRAMPASVQGNNGSDSLMAMLRTLRDGFDLAGADFWSVVDMWNEERASPRWTRAELDHALENIERTPPQRGRGWLMETNGVKATTHGTLAVETGPICLSERFMAERLAAGTLRRSLRFLPEGPAQGWWRWDSVSWTAAPDPVPVVLAAAIHHEASVWIAEGKLDLKTARQLESTASIRAVLTQLQAHDSLRFDPAAIDPPYHLATTNGVLDLETGTLCTADPDGAAFLHRAAVAYDPHAQHPLWSAVERHVAAMPAGDTVQRFLGASLIGLPPDRKLLVLLGDGGDGKGTLLRSCIAAAGTFGAVLPAEGLAGDGRGAHGHELLSPLGTARLAYASEVPAAMDWNLLKALSGGDGRQTKRMHSRAYCVQPRAWLALATNAKPQTPDRAAADRVILVQWNKPDDPDPDIVGLIATPGPQRDAYLRACLAWMVRGAFDFQREGLGVPDFARPAIEPEGLAGWWETCVEMGEISLNRGWTPFQPLNDHATRWHTDRGAELPSKTAVGTFLRSRVGCRRTLVNGSKVVAYRATIMDRVGHG